MLKILFDLFVGTILVLTITLGTLVLLLGLMYIGIWGADFFSGIPNIAFWAVWVFVMIGVINGVGTIFSKNISA